MATSHGGFESIAEINTELIREALRRTMVLGLPEEDSEKPTFYWDKDVVWADHDTENNPWDWTVAASSDTTPSPVSPVCAVEFNAPFGRTSEAITAVGDFDYASVVISLFEDEFDSVEGATYVQFGPGSKKYFFRYYKPAAGLGDMTLYQTFFVADGER